jgi:hypothetical protein
VWLSRDMTLFELREKLFASQVRAARGEERKKDRFFFFFLICFKN